MEVAEELLVGAPAIDELRERLGGYRKAARDWPGLAARRTALEEQAGQRFAEIRPDMSFGDVEQVRPLLAHRRRATELGGRQEALESAVRKARERRKDVVGTLAAKWDDLGRLPPSVSYGLLQNAVDEARRTGDVDSSLEAGNAALVRHDEACRRDIGSLGLWTTSVVDLAKVPMPGEETLRRFIGAFQAIEEEQRGLESSISDAQSEQ